MKKRIYLPIRKKIFLFANTLAYSYLLYKLCYGFFLVFLWFARKSNRNHDCWSFKMICCMYLHFCNMKCFSQQCSFLSLQLMIFVFCLWIFFGILHFYYMCRHPFFTGFTRSVEVLLHSWKLVWKCLCHHRQG